MALRAESSRAAAHSVAREQDLPGGNGPQRSTTMVGDRARRCSPTRLHLLQQLQRRARGQEAGDQGAMVETATVDLRETMDEDPR